MSEFFIKTEDSFVGPFTGVELREAALAGILGPGDEIAKSPVGPGVVAMDAGLFSKQRVALPHPPDTQIALYHVRGLRISARGPFRLQELIGFAAGGMMNRDASVQNSLQPDWYPVDRIGILAACLAGDLSLSGLSQVMRSSEALDVDPLGWFDSGCFESNAGRESDQSHGDAQSVPQQTSIPASSGIPASTDADAFVRANGVGSGSTSTLNPTVSLASAKKALLVAVCLSVAFVACSTVYSIWQDFGTQADEIVGDWIAADGTFGIAFRQNGSCVVFNTAGESWMGEYDWLPFNISGSELDFNDSQFVRYGLLQLVLAADGSVQYASLHE